MEIEPADADPGPQGGPLHSGRRRRAAYYAIAGGVALGFNDGNPRVKYASGLDLLRQTPVRLTELDDLRQEVCKQAGLTLQSLCSHNHLIGLGSYLKSNIRRGNLSRGNCHTC